MNKILTFAILVASLSIYTPNAIFAQEPTTLEEAKVLATQSHRLVLIEFFRDD